MVDSFIPIPRRWVLLSWTRYQGALRMQVPTGIRTVAPLVPMALPSRLNAAISSVEPLQAAPNQFAHNDGIAGPLNTVFPDPVKCCDKEEPSMEPLIVSVIPVLTEKIQPCPAIKCTLAGIVDVAETIHVVAPHSKSIGFVIPAKASVFQLWLAIKLR